jgi:hypothetical protein
MTWESLQRAFEQSPLRQRGVKLPRPGTQAGEVLRYLFEHKGNVVQKAECERVVCARLGIPTKDLQDLRHLGKQRGFDILQGGSLHEGKKLKRGQYVLRGLVRTNDFWSIKRRDANDLDFVALKSKYNNACASCGAKEGRPHRYTGQIVVLEKGHMDPSQPMTANNIIPQCPYCNKVAGDKWVWDKMGFPKYMTMEGLMSHSEEVLRQFHQKLEERFNG